MALDAAVLIGRHTLQLGLGTLSGLGAVVNGVQCISGLVGLCNKSMEGADGVVVSTGKKVQDVFLSGVRCIGMTAGTLHWAQFCGWISLGSAAPFIGFIGYPTLFIASVYDLSKMWNKLVEIMDKPNLDFYEWKAGIESIKLVSLVLQVCLVAYAVVAIMDKPNLDFYEWKVVIESIKLISQVCLVAYSVIGAVAVITAGPALSLAAFATIFLYGFLIGVAYSLNKRIDKWVPPRVALAT